jgi:hypothetical protein
MLDSEYARIGAFGDYLLPLTFELRSWEGNVQNCWRGDRRGCVSQSRQGH